MILQNSKEQNMIKIFSVETAVKCSDSEWLKSFLQNY